MTQLDHVIRVNKKVQTHRVHKKQLLFTWIKINVQLCIHQNHPMYDQKTSLHVPSCNRLCVLVMIAMATDTLDRWYKERFCLCWCAKEQEMYQISDHIVDIVYKEEEK